MTNTEQDMWKAVAECTVAKIHGQPMNQDIDCLDNELTATASSVSSKSGEGYMATRG